MLFSMTWLARALEICASHRGEVRGQGSDPAAVWRASFLRGPHLRDAFVRLGLVSETFETAVTWDRFWQFHEGVLAAARQAVRQACGGGVVSCRFAYVYPDGPAPYYSVVAAGRRGHELEQWDEIKRAASEEPVVPPDGGISPANTMPYILECVRAYATVGEICDALREVYGTYEEVSIT